ncbi:hypothetical protein [Candidatus Marithrix sp. Canyon 246]|uniref:hypothetical protein n=1 Tax=Candidatus Marithrix sp. Canyon 246 TaxID=1827136 RepID=UPI00084A1BAB|nr:hypothetical protein [Candidatus Marithrix sp. Canyon 246]
MLKQTILAIILMLSTEVTFAAVTLLNSSFLGSKEFEITHALAIADNGDVIVALRTNSPNYSIPAGAYLNTYQGNFDALIVRLDANLTQLRAATYFGGNGDDTIQALTIAPNGDIIVAGITRSSDFPVTDGAYSRHKGKADSFIARFDANLTKLHSASLLGGNNEDYIRAIAVAENGDIVVAGWTGSVDFPTTEGAYMKQYQGSSYGDGFIARLDANLTQLRAASFLGGSNGDFINTLAIDNNGEVVVAGKTWSVNFPTTENAYLGKSDDNAEAFIARLDPNFSQLVAASFLGGGKNPDNTDSTDEIKTLIIGPNSEIIVAGSTKSLNFPTTEAAYLTKSPDRTNGFVAKFNSQLSQLEAATLLQVEVINSLGLAASGEIVVAGKTISAHFPNTEGGQAQGGFEGFVTSFDNKLSELHSSIFVGGKEYDEVTHLAITSANQVFAIGWTNSPEFVTTKGAYLEQFQGGNYGDAFVASFEGIVEKAIINTNISPLEFVGIKPSYAIGEKMNIDLKVKFFPNSICERADLWLALRLPNGPIFYRDNSGVNIFNLLPVAFQTDIKNKIETNYHILKDIPVIPELAGEYTFYAFFNLEGKGIDNWMDTLCSEIVRVKISLVL